MSNGADVIREGYKKVSLSVLLVFRKLTRFQHGSAPFKVANVFSWVVVISSHDHIEEFRKAPEDVLSSSEATNDVSQCLVFPSYLH